MCNPVGLLLKNLCSKNIKYQIVVEDANAVRLWPTEEGFEIISLPLDNIKFSIRPWVSCFTSFDKRTRALKLCSSANSRVFWHNKDRPCKGVGRAAIALDQEYWNMSPSHIPELTKDDLLVESYALMSHVISSGNEFD